MWITKKYSLVKIALIVVELFQKRTNFGEFWGCDWSLTQYAEAPDSRWEQKKFIPPTGSRRDWILN